MDNTTTAITTGYIDIALKKLKVARNFSVQYFGICIPKNAIYGRITHNMYMYIDDFDQFKPVYKHTCFSIHVLDQRKDSRFKKIIVKKHTEWYNMIFAFIEYHELFDTKCEYQLCINRCGGKPERKQPQTQSGYTYSVPYRHRKVLEWENTFTTETDAVQKPVYAQIDRKKVDQIINRQKKQDRILEENRNNWKKWM